MIAVALRLGDPRRGRVEARHLEAERLPDLLDALLAEVSVTFP